TTALPLLMPHPPPRSTPFPYTTLFRSDERARQHRQRRQHQEGRERGEDAGGERAPALEAPREPLVQGMQDERQHRRPAEHAAQEIGRAHVLTPVTSLSRMPSSA